MVDWKDPGDTSSILSQVKREATESDDEVCIIEEEPADKPSPSKHKLYLPPANCPQYHPTPIKDLLRKPPDQQNVLGDIGDLSESDQEYMETPDVLGDDMRGLTGSLISF